MPGLYQPHLLVRPPCICISLIMFMSHLHVQEVLLLASMAGLEVQELYGEMATDVDLNHEEAYRMIAVLKKKA